MEKIIVSGFGGQGVLFAGKLLAFSGMVTGRYVSWIPSYGPEMRGGTANCSVILSERKITSPIVNKCTTLIALNGPSLEKFQSSVENDGKILFDKPLANEKVEGIQAQWKPVPASELSLEMGAPGLMNMVMLGAYIRESSILTLDDIFMGMEEMLSGKKQELIKLNQKALEAGYEWGVESYV